MEGDDTISFQNSRELVEITRKPSNDEEIKPGESSVTESADSAATTTTAPDPEAGGYDDVLEIPKDTTEDYGNCFVEVVNKGLYKPTSYKPPAPAPSLSKKDAAPKEEPAAENPTGFAAFMKQVRDGILTGQKDRTKDRCKGTMKFFNELPRDQAPFVPPADVEPVIDFRCHCIVDCDVDGKKSPYIAQGWLTVTQTALIFNGTLVLSPARPMSVPEPKEEDVVFAIDNSTLVSVVAAQSDDADDAEVLAGTRAPSIIACESVDSASALILFDRSNHAHQFYDFSWCFTNYAPDAVRSIIYQLNLPEAGAEPKPEQPVVSEEIHADEAPKEADQKKEDEVKEPQEDVTTISMDDSVVAA